MANSKLPREFMHFIMARLLFVLGLRMIATIVIYQVFHLANTYMVGLAGLAEFVPAVIAALFAGHYIDKHNKKNILVWAYACYMICGLTLAFISLPGLALGNPTRLTVIFIVVFCTGVFRSFAGPAANSMIAAIVSREQLPKAISYNSSAWLISSIGGHAIGGLLIAFIGISGAYFTTAACIFAAGIFAWQILPKPPVQNLDNEPVLRSIQKGFAYVFNNKNLLGVISLDLFAVLFGGAVAFIPEIASAVLHTGPIGYGFLNAAMDLGSLICIGMLVKYPLKTRQGIKMLLAVAGFGLSIIIFGLSKVYWLSFMALMAAGVFDAVSVVVRGTIMQLYTPDELRGRVASINLIFINSSNELGQFESGLTSRLFGTVNAIIFGGAMSLLVVAATWLKFPNLRKLKY